MTRVSQTNFAFEEQQEFKTICAEFRFNPDSFMYGATGDVPAMGAGMIAREVTIARNGRITKYPGRGWLQTFREELLSGKWGSSDLP